MFNLDRVLKKPEDTEGVADQRIKNDRRVNKMKTKFPFVDDNNKLVLKERRVSARRDADIKKNPLTLIKNRLTNNQ